MSAEALRARGAEILREIVSFRSGGKTAEKNVRKLMALRHERARILTLLRERLVSR